MDAASWTALAAFAGATVAAASTGAVFQPGAWYRALAKPAWTPPDWLFPVAWTVLYTMIATAGFLVWRAAGPAGWLVYVVFGAQLALNAAWSYLFFSKRRIDWAMIDVALLGASIAALIALSAPWSGTAALLLAPYFVWVAFAGALNFDILRRNGAAPRPEVSA
jgi:tryptophan-rich sensory protein